MSKTWAWVWVCVAWICVAMAVGFVWGQGVRSSPSPKTEKVYGLPEGVTIQEICNGIYGEERDRIFSEINKEADQARKAVMDKQTRALKEIDDWKAAYKDGFSDREAR